MNKAQKWKEIEEDFPELAEAIRNLADGFNTKTNKISLSSFDYVNRELSTEEICKPTLRYVKPFVEER